MFNRRQRRRTDGLWTQPNMTAPCGSPSATVTFGYYDVGLRSFHSLTQRYIVSRLWRQPQNGGWVV